MGTPCGAMAQLVAHHTGSVGVTGSSPVSSTSRSEGIFRVTELLPVWAIPQCNTQMRFRGPLASKSWS
jgi:hypothetical protein